MLNFSQKANQTINKYLSIKETNRLAIGIIFKDGTRDFFVSENADAKTEFDIGSISKTFTAALILKLISEGKLSLDARADEYIDLPKGIYPKISQLLTHTAGYWHFTPAEITIPALLKKRYSVANLYRRVTEKNVIKCLARRNKTRENSYYGYSDFAYAILAIIASRVTGVPFFELLDGFIKDELKLSKSYVAKPFRKDVSYLSKKAIPSWHWERSNPYVSGGGIVSNIVDMTDYMALQLKEDISFIKDSHKVFEAAFSKKSNIGCALGWHTYKNSNQLWHVGGVGTYRSSMIFNVKRGIGITVLGNASGRRSANVHYLAKLLYSEIRRNKLHTNKK